MATDRIEISDEEYASMVFHEGDSLVVDLSNVAEMKFENLPKGTYEAMVDSCEFGMSQNSGAPMFTLKFKIAEGEYEGRTTPPFYASFSPKALPGTKTSLLRLDPEIFQGPFQPEEVANSGALLGKPCKVKITHEDYQGEPRARVQYILSSEGASGGDGFA